MNFFLPLIPGVGMGAGGVTAAASSLLVLALMLTYENETPLALTYENQVPLTLDYGTALEVELSFDGHA